MEISRPKIVRAAVYGFVSLAFLFAALGSVLAYRYFNLTSPSNPASVSYLASTIIEIRSLRTDLRLLGESPISGPQEIQELRMINEKLDQLASAFQNDPPAQAGFQEARQQLDRLVSSARPGQPAATREAVAPILLVLDRVLTTAHVRLLERESLQAGSTRTSVFAMCVLSTALFILAIVTSIVIRLELRRREIAEYTISLEKQELARYTSEIALVARGSELIQAATSQDQVLDSVAYVLQTLVPESAGFVALLDPANDRAEIRSSWGNGPLCAPFHPHECLALQLNRPIHRAESPTTLKCRHALASDVDTICAPVHGAGSPLGVVHVGTPVPLSGERVYTISAIASHFGFGLANLRLREAFKEQSVRDGLTDLFNRRYFDETLQRELAVAVRQQESLCLLMLDIDHFKVLNDTYGHAAGDETLRVLGQLLRGAFREGDLLCRYGGEEFAFILVGAELSDAFSKAEGLRQVVQEAEFSVGSQVIQNVTVSIGIASSLEFKTPGRLLRAADVALYQAKHSGRNATWVCSNAASGLPSIAPDRRRS